MNRRSLLKSALSVLGILSLSRAFKLSPALAQAKKKAKGGGVGMVFATEESLKGLPAAAGVTPNSFWDENDKISQVQNFCNAAVSPNSACGPKHQPGQYCGSCTFLQERAVYDGNVVGKCALIQP